MFADGLEKSFGMPGLRQTIQCMSKQRAFVGVSFNSFVDKYDSSSWRFGMQDLKQPI